MPSEAKLTGPRLREFPTLTGPQLRELRRRRGLRAVDIGNAMRVSRQRIGQIEAAAAPASRDVRRFFAVLLAIDLERAS
jgi:transcriptional regulator with XRE-family HTH domain